MPTNQLTQAFTLTSHLSPTKWPSFLLQSGDDSSPCNGKGTINIYLYFIVGVTHLGNQHIQQDHQHSNQEGQVHDSREPPGEGGGRVSKYLVGQLQTMLHAHSLVAHIHPIIVIKEVKDSSRLNEDSETSEHHMPWVPAAAYEIYMYVPNAIQGPTV